MLVPHRVRGWRAATGLAQAQHPLVYVVPAGRGGRPRVIATAADLHEQIGAGEGDTARVNARPMDILLDQELRDEVGGLGPEDRDRVTRLRVLGADEQRVAERLRESRDRRGVAADSGEEGPRGGGPPPRWGGR